MMQHTRRARRILLLVTGLAGVGAMTAGLTLALGPVQAARPNTTVRVGSPAAQAPAAPPAQAPAATSTCSGPTGTAYVADAGFDGFTAIQTSDCKVITTYNVDDPGNPGDEGDANFNSTDEAEALVGKNLYVADTGTSTVAVIDTATLDPSKVDQDNYPPETLINVGMFPEFLAADPSGEQVWVADTGSQSGFGSASALSVISTATNTVVASAPLGSAPKGIAFSPNGQRAYVTTGQGLLVFGLSAPGGSGTRRLALEAVVRGLDQPQGVAVSPNGRDIYVTNAGNATVSSISTTTNRVVGVIPVGQLPWQVVFAPDGATAYVADADSDQVSVIDTADGQVKNTLSIPGDPDALAVTADGSQLWIGENAAGTVDVLNTKTFALTKLYLGAAFEPTGIAIGA